MSIELVSATETSEPVTLQEVKTYLRLDSATDDDAMLTAMIVSARKSLERFTSQALVPQVWRVTEDVLRKGDRVWAPRVPVASAVFEVYSGGAWVTQAGASLAAGEGRVTITALPDVADSQYDNFRVTFTSTRTAANVPAEFKTAILELVSYWYDNRGDGAVMPDKVRGIVQPFRVYRA